MCHQDHNWLVVASNGAMATHFVTRAFSLCCFMFFCFAWFCYVWCCFSPPFRAGLLELVRSPLTPNTHSLTHSLTHVKQCQRMSRANDDCNWQIQIAKWGWQKKMTEGENDRIKTTDEDDWWKWQISMSDEMSDEYDLWECQGNDRIKPTDKEDCW